MLPKSVGRHHRDPPKSQDASSRAAYDETLVLSRRMAQTVQDTPKRSKPYIVTDFNSLNGRSQKYRRKSGCDRRPPTRKRRFQNIFKTSCRQMGWQLSTHSKEEAPLSDSTRRTFTRIDELVSRPGKNWNEVVIDKEHATAI